MKDDSVTESSNEARKDLKFLQCDNGDQQLYLWCWKRPSSSAASAEANIEAVHRAGAGLEGQ